MQSLIFGEWGSCGVEWLVPGGGNHTREVEVVLVGLQQMTPVVADWLEQSYSHLNSRRLQSWNWVRTRVAMENGGLSHSHLCAEAWVGLCNQYRCWLERQLRRWKRTRCWWMEYWCLTRNWHGCLTWSRCLIWPHPKHELLQLGIFHSSQGLSHNYVGMKSDDQLEIKSDDQLKIK